MAEENKTETKEKETKKLDDLKETPENKAAIAAHTGVPFEKGKAEGKVVSEKKSESKPAVEKAPKTEAKKDAVELEREYVVPLKKGVLNVPQYRRAKKAIRVLREFIVRHMKVRDRDLKKVKIDAYLNNELWFRGIKKPANKIKVKAVKKSDGFVYVSLSEPAEAVKFVMARDEKRRLAAEATKVKKPKKVDEKVDKDKDKDGVDDKVEEAEDKKAGAEKAAKVEKSATKDLKHSTKGAHAKKAMPVRKVLK
jgi:large subunit ribosomal protein L31e